VLGFLAALGVLRVLADAGRSPTLRWVGARRQASVAGTGVEDAKSLAAWLHGRLWRKPVEIERVEAKRLEALCKRKWAFVKALDPTERRAKLAEHDPGLLAEIEGLSEPEAVERVAMASRRASSEYRAARLRVIVDPVVSLGERLECEVEEFASHCRDALAAAVKAVEDGGREGLEEGRCWVDFCAAFGGPDGEGFVDTPLSLCRGAGNQNYLDIVNKLLCEVEIGDFEVALMEDGFEHGKWESRFGDTMRWEPNADRRHARSARAPGGIPKPSLWAANLLAFHGTRMIPCLPGGEPALGWRDVKRDREVRTLWRWPLWEDAIGIDEVRSLLGHPRLWRDTDDLAAAGVSSVWETERIMLGKPPACPRIMGVPRPVW
jgi:hypothetical protein